jgi:hypothetical protein
VGVYASQSDVVAYFVEGVTVQSTAALDRLIDHAERDVDHACGDWPVDPTSMRKFPLSMGSRPSSATR